MKEMRITEEEIALLKSTFRDNERLLKVLRKIFLPEIQSDAPLGQNIDLWMTVPVKDYTPEQVMINMLARNQLIQHLENSLIQINTLANTDAKTPEELEEARKKNSNK